MDTNNAKILDITSLINTIEKLLEDIGAIHNVTNAYQMATYKIIEHTLGAVSNVWKTHYTY